MVSVSKVMKLSWTQEARLALLLSSKRRCSAVSMNFLASSGVGRRAWRLRVERSRGEGYDEQHERRKFRDVIHWAFLVVM